MRRAIVILALLPLVGCRSLVAPDEARDPVRRGPPSGPRGPTGKIESLPYDWSTLSLVSATTTRSRVRIAFQTDRANRLPHDLSFQVFLNLDQENTGDALHGAESVALSTWVEDAGSGRMAIRSCSPGEGWGDLRGYANVTESPGRWLVEIPRRALREMRNDGVVDFTIEFSRAGRQLPAYALYGSTEVLNAVTPESRP